MAAKPKRPRGTWVWGVALTKEDKARIAATCEAFIAGFLVPKFLPEIRPTAFNYPVALSGKWRGNSYSFIQRYRSGFPHNTGQESDHAYARLDHASGDRFDLMWHRHTGQWLPYRPNLTLEEALEVMRTDNLVQPL
jgi:hypothetical protein